MATRIPTRPREESAQASALAEAQRRFAQTDKEHRTSIAETLAGTLIEPGARSRVPARKGASPALQRKLSSGHAPELRNRASQWTTGRCRLEGGREFDGGSGQLLVNALLANTPVPNVARKYSRAEPATGELATILLMGDGLSSYDHTPIDGVDFLGLFDEHTTSAYVERIVYPGADAPEYDTGMIGLVQLPSSIPTYISPTADGGFDGLVWLGGDIRMEFYAWTPSGVVYEVTGSRFLEGAASRRYSAGWSYIDTTVLGLEAIVPAGAIAMITRITLTLRVLRTKASPGVSATGGFVGAAIANDGTDPWSGVWFGVNRGRASVTLLTNTCD